MEQRLIDANELLKHIWKDRIDTRGLIDQMVNNAPTIPAVPVDQIKEMLSEIDKLPKYCADLGEGNIGIVVDLSELMPLVQKYTKEQEVEDGKD